MLKKNMSDSASKNSEAPRCEGHLARGGSTDDAAPLPDGKPSPFICAGCNVQGVWEHRCYHDDMDGEPSCECPECNPSVIDTVHKKGSNSDD